MPRCARIKNNDSIIYIIVKGMSDVPLFREEDDKNEYLSLLKKYGKFYVYDIYAYCVMKDYAHFIINLNGSDISKIMSSINVAYSGKYNRKYNRHGHLFYGRFKSKIIKDDFELKSFTLYIHNSPAQIEEYKAVPYEYTFSSLGAYIGKKDLFEILDMGFIKEFIGSGKQARKNYLELVPMYDTKVLIKEIESISKETKIKYCTKKDIPNVTPEEILEFVSAHTGINKMRLNLKHSRETTEAKSLAVFIMRTLCDFKSAKICKALGDISQTTLTKLFNTGLGLVEEDDKYKALMDEFKEKYISI